MNSSQLLVASLFLISLLSIAGVLLWKFVFVKCKWALGNWEPCADGSQQRNVTCSCGDGSRCPGPKPANTQSCGCRWLTGSWGDCKDGVDQRSVTCSCGAVDQCPSPKPADAQSCGCQWLIGPWGDCMDGVEQRGVTCSCGVVDQCPPPEPADAQSCVCQWITGTWGECKDGVEQRCVTCSCGAVDGCPAPEPNDVQSCGCQWITEAWGDCVAGVQKRSVTCSCGAVDQCPDPKPADAQSCPAPPPAPQGETGCLIFRNKTGDAITVWLDMGCPPCLPESAYCTWEKNGSTFWIKDAQGAKHPAASAHNQDLQPDEEWYIQLPKDTGGLPVWCCSRGCIGAGAWFTKTKTSMAAPQNVLRVEYNWNGDAIWYNLSGVDGVNSNVSVVYTSCQQETHCNVDLSKCPFKETPAGAGATCSAAKVYDNCKDCAGLDGLSACQLAGCGYSDPGTMCKCRRWWRDDPCALKWCDWLRQGDCDMYCWAYDELTLDPTVTDCTGHLTPNPEKPLRTCRKTADGNLVVTVTKVMA